MQNRNDKSCTNRMRYFLCDDNLNLMLRQRMTEYYIWSKLSFGVLLYTLEINTMNRLQTFEMWLQRRMLRIPWVDHVINTEILRGTNTNRQILRTIKCRKIAYLGHILKGDKC